MPVNHFCPSLRILVLMFVLIIGLSSSACEPVSFQKKSETTSTPAEVKLTSIERDIKSMKTADFEVIFVFRRMDGAVFSGEDKAYLKANSPEYTNRFVISDDDKAVVVGSSYKFEPKQLELLGKRFLIEDHSEPKKVEETNLNQNSRSNS